MLVEPPVVMIEPPDILVYPPILSIKNKFLIFFFSYHGFVSILSHCKKKSRIRETSNLSTDVDRRNDTILESLRDLSRKKEEKKWGG